MWTWISIMSTELKQCKWKTIASFLLDWAYESCALKLQHPRCIECNGVVLRSYGVCETQHLTLNDFQGASASVVIADNGSGKASTPRPAEEPLLTVADFTFHAVTDLETHAQYIQVSNWRVWFGQGFTSKHHRFGLYYIYTGSKILLKWSDHVRADWCPS